MEQKTVVLVDSNCPKSWIDELYDLLSPHYQVCLVRDHSTAAFPLAVQIHLQIDEFLFGRSSKKTNRIIAEVSFEETIQKDWILIFDEQLISKYQSAKKLWLIPFGKTAGYWELVYQEGVVRSEIYEVVNGQKKLIASSTKRTDFDSIFRNRANKQQRLKLMISRLISGKPHYHNAAETVRAVEKVALRNIILHFYRILKRSLSRNDNWNVAIGSREDSGSLSTIRWLDRPNNTLWADPFPVTFDGRLFVFVEEVLSGETKGHISVLELNKNFDVINRKVVLTKKYHLSYPNVFQHENIWYMIPETKEAKSIQLYKSTNFPYDWNFVMNLMDDIWAVDSTIYFDGNLWWLFANVCEQDGESAINDELYLFFSENLLSSDWSPHPLNPIISDAALARPAGGIFEDGGRLYRPSQNSSYKYGWGINLMEILILKPELYKEMLIEKIRPDKTDIFKRTHTYQKMENYIFTDLISKYREINRSYE